jgi:CRP-like cAMP-binding protein
MKLLYREDVQEAGYDLPAQGLCENIAEQEMEALKFGGEWVLASDEVLVSDGYEQQFLYLVVSGQVGIYKADDQGKNQQIASLGTGAAFGEMAFLSGGVASATVQAVGECVLWRMNHERLLEFIGENGFAGGQLCLNVASILSGRLIDGNKKVLDMGRELQDSLQHLQSATSADQQKSAALKQMQSKVSSMQSAFKGASVKKSGLSPVAIVAFVLAGLSTLGMIGLFVSIDDSVAQRAEDLAKKVDKLEKNEAFYLTLKKRLESENEDMVKQTKSLAQEKEALEKEVNRAEDDMADLRSEVRSLERDLSKAKDDVVRAQRVDTSAMADKLEEAKNQAIEKFTNDVTEWAKKNTTLAFPVEVQLLNEKITLMSRDQRMKVPVNLGESLRALRFHPSAQGFIIVGQLHSDKLLAVTKIDNLNFAEALSSKYVRYMSTRGNAVANPFAKKKSLNENDGKQSASSGSSKSLSQVGETPEPIAPPLSQPKVIQSKAMLPQKDTDFLKSTAPSNSNANPHGNSCVCKDCRAKKVGKGSLFPE